MNDMLLQVEPLIPALRRYARALMRNAASADDLVQDCLERAVSRWHQRRDGNARSWLFTILHNLAVNQFRQSAARGKHVTIDETNEDDFGRDAVQEQQLMYRDVLDKLAKLPEDQRAVLRQVLQSSDRITGLRGLAGSGKTTTLKELKTACEKAGYSLRFCAPTAAATDVLRQEGFEAVTLASLLQRKLEPGDKTVVVLDEAGAVGIDDMRRLFELTKHHRLILSGDTGQHASVARGDALRILEDHSPYAFGRLTQIRRQQRADYRRAVELAANGQTTAAFAQLERMGAVNELGREELHAAAARTYLSVVEKRKTALLVAPTWAEIEALNENVRRTLKERGQLQGEEQEFRVFDSLSWTEAQKRDPRQYQPGLVLHFHQSARGFARHESVEVDLATEDSLRVRRADDSVSSLRLDASRACFEVGEWRILTIAPGDKLLLQTNRSRQFINGELVEVKALAGQSILLSDGRTLPPEYRAFTHGYAVTSHAAQGKTVDEVLVVASSRSLPAVHREQFYVSISRGRQRCHVFTDDKDLLRAHIAHSSIRIAAVEAVVVPKARRALVRQLLAWAENFRHLVRLGQVLRQPVSPQKPIAWTRKVRRHHRYEYHHYHSRTLRV